MRIICCHAGPVRAEVAEAIGKYAPETTFIEVQGLFGYAEAILRNWTGKEDLVILEHDILINEHVIPQFTDCPAPRCVFSYPVFNGRLEAERSLGCSKFSAELQGMVHPVEFLFSANQTDWGTCECRGVGCWREIDVRLDQRLKYHYAISPHVHGRVEHLHEYGASR